jgi:hypothetical protein
VSLKLQNLYQNLSLLQSRPLKVLQKQHLSQQQNQRQNPLLRSLQRQVLNRMSRLLSRWKMLQVVLHPVVMVRGR